MSPLLVDDLAQFIRRVDDHQSRLGASQLGATIVAFLHERGVPMDEPTENGIDDFVYDANAGVGYMQPKRLTGEALAKAVVAEFKLEDKQ